MINLVLVTSVIRNPVESPYRTEMERLGETINTFKSIRENIPNSYIVLLEGGDFNQSDDQLFIEHVDDVFYQSVKGLHRSLGELTLLSNYFDSPSFFEIKEKISTLSKISGRYHLNSNFKFDELTEVIKKDDVCWSGKGACSTRYWRVTHKDIDNTISSLKTVKENFGSYIDIEHAFYEYQVVPLKNLESGKHVGVTGFVSPMGFYEDA